MPAKDEIKLHLGCGDIYKVGYINIDCYNKEIPDVLCDVEDLPFESNSVDRMEAYHLIEHFDYIHCKYVLSEWFRVLKSGGFLILETPDLEKSFKKFLKSRDKEKTLQWIYGIDSLGMQHKTGFTFDLLKSVLKEIGYEKISKKKAKTHIYDPGMRVICRKPIDCKEYQFFAEFRSKLRKELSYFKDSLLLIPLEKYVAKAIDIFSKRDLDWERQIISEISLHCPVIPKVFLQEAMNFEFSNLNKNILSLAELLAEKEFSNKIFSLWIRRKKSLNVIQEFERFVEDIKNLVYKVAKSEKIELERLEYILSLPSESIQIFDFDLVMLKAMKLCNMGIKMFYKGKFNKALELLKKSSNINPSNPMVWWNLARLEIAMGNYEKNRVEEYYKRAYLLLKNSKLRKNVKAEMGLFHTDPKEIPPQPVWEDL